jgi:hypothetical protein
MVTFSLARPADAKHTKKTTGTALNSRELDIMGLLALMKPLHFAPDSGKLQKIYATLFAVPGKEYAGGYQATLPLPFNL